MSDPISIEFESRLLPGGVANVSRQRGTVDRKWPVWLRLLVILGISAVLWGAILTGVMYLIS